MCFFMTNESVLENEISSPETTSEATSNVLHIPDLQWSPIPFLKDTFLENFITQTTFTTWVFMILLFSVVFIVNSQIKSWKRWKLRTFFELLISYMKNWFESFLWCKHFARKNFYIVATVFFFVALWNLFWLLIEVVFALVEPVYPAIHYYFRPINSDLNTTAFLAVMTIILAQFYHIKSKWAVNHIIWYLFNFRWDSFFSKIWNVLFWWLHLVWELARVVSLSFRLFWNILAWMILIIVMTWLSTKYLGVPFWATIPFFLFEIFVSLFQWFIFVLLMLLYFKEANSKAH